MRRKTLHKNNNGFTILELAVVLVVIGLLISFGVVAWISMKNSQQVSTSRTLLRIASDCLTTYVIHSEQIPPQAYFTSKCASNDPWGNSLLYENSGDNVRVDTVVAKTFRDGSGDYPDAAWIVYSTGADRTKNMTTSSSLWNCSTGDDICQVITKNALLYEINK